MASERRDIEKRPSPDALLEAARRESEHPGRLKIFLGAAPGVGKTYEMLQSAHAKLRAGADIVVGYVETHGRSETEALLRGLEAIPRKRLEYTGTLMPVARGIRRSRSSTNLPTPMRPAAAIPSAISTSRSCSRTGSTSTPQS